MKASWNKQRRVGGEFYVWHVFTIFKIWHVFKILLWLINGYTTFLFSELTPIKGSRDGESAHLLPLWPGFVFGWESCVEFVVGSHPCSEGFLPGTPVFLPPQKHACLNSNSIWNPIRGPQFTSVTLVNFLIYHCVVLSQQLMPSLSWYVSDILLASCHFSRSKHS